MCSTNATNSEISDEEYSFNEFLAEPHALDEEQPVLMTTDSPIDISNDVVFKSELDSNSDAIEELLIEGMQCEFVSMLGKKKSYSKTVKLLDRLYLLIFAGKL